jgi:hypothetical protein
MDDGLGKAVEASDSGNKTSGFFEGSKTLTRLGAGLPARTNQEELLSPKAFVQRGGGMTGHRG